MTREIHAGAGYCSQDSAAEVFAVALPAQISVRWPGGKTLAAEVPAGSTEVVVDYASGLKVIR
jgi:hypothetical protein